MLNKIKRLAPLLFLLLHPVFLALVFTLGFLGIVSEHFTLLLTGIVSLEAIYIAFFIRAKLNKTVRNLVDMEGKMQDLREDADSLARMQRELIYAGHQIKTLQMDLYSLKKTNSIKISGNGNHRRAHSQAMSHS